MSLESPTVYMLLKSVIVGIVYNGNNVLYGFIFIVSSIFFAVGEHQARSPGPLGAAGEGVERRPSCYAV